MSMYQSVLQTVAKNDHWGVHLCRISIAIVFLWIGWLKLILYIRCHNPFLFNESIY